MRKILLATAATIALTVTGPARAAEFFTGNDLLVACQSSDYRDRGFTMCLGFIVAMGDLTNMLNAMSVNLVNASHGDMTHAIEWCRPEGANNGQLVDVVRKYLHDHPEQRHLPAVMLVLDAFGAAFPCR